MYGNSQGSGRRFHLRKGGDISQSHAAAVLVPQDNVAELVWRKTLSFGSKDHALVRGIYESGSADTGRSPGGIEHFINRRAELDQAVRADLDLKLANLSAEHRGNDGESLNRLRTDRLQTRNSVHRRLDRSCDELFDLLRRQPNGLGLNDDLRRSEFGKDVQLRPRRRINAVAEHHDTECDDDSSKPQRKINEPSQHCRLTFVRLLRRLEFATSALQKA